MQSLISNGVAPRDGNGRNVTSLGLVLNEAVTFTGSGATVAVPIFTITGTVEILSLSGVVTTALGNHTAAYWRLNDQAAQVDITASSGTSLTSAAVGTTIVKKALAATALTALTSAAGRVSEPAAAEGQYFSPFLAVKKSGATTQIEYVYTTSDTPTTGAILFSIQWLPVSSDGAITTV